MENNFNLVELEPHKNLNIPRLPTPLSALGKTLNTDLKNKNGQGFLKLGIRSVWIKSLLFRHCHKFYVEVRERGIKKAW